jgi:S-adenosylmethionine hydrolase
MKKLALVMQTDFGPGIAVCAMKAVCHSVDPDLKIYDGTHHIRQFDVLTASDTLMYYLPYWPKETVFISVVDPGVGTKRRSCVARLTSGQYVVTPDNGALTYVKQEIGIDEVREIDERVNRLPDSQNVHIFHGRDVYSYCAARLAAAVITFEQVGPAYSVEDVVEIDFPRPTVVGDGSITGMVNHAYEHFGLLSTNIPFVWLAEIGMNYGDTVKVSISHRDKVVYDRVLPLARTFGEVAVGETLVLSTETRAVMVAINQGNFVTEHNIGYGADWKFEIRKAD